MVNEDCARDLLQYLDSCLEISSTGKRVKPIKLKKVLHEEPLSNYTSDDIYNAAEYLVKLGLVNLPITRSTALKGGARSYVFTGISAKGTEYLKVTRNPTTWEQLKSHFVSVFNAAMSSISSFILQAGIELLK